MTIKSHKSAWCGSTAVEQTTPLRGPVTDTTGKRRAKRKIRRANARLRRAFDIIEYLKLLKTTLIHTKLDPFGPFSAVRAHELHTADVLCTGQPHWST